MYVAYCIPGLHFRDTYLVLRRYDVLARMPALGTLYLYRLSYILVRITDLKGLANLRFAVRCHVCERWRGRRFWVLMPNSVPVAKGQANKARLDFLIEHTNTFPA